MGRDEVLTDEEIKEQEHKKLLKSVGRLTAYYRANPQRFVKEYLGIDYLKTFQKILLYCMMHYDCFFFIACRGIGKTYLVALFCICRCILFPGTKIIVSSYTFKQGQETVKKITEDFMHNSPMLCKEIQKWSTSINDCGVYFKNGSWIQVRVAAESSRGARANCLIIDESRMVSKVIIDTVLTPMLNAPRSPGYLKNKKYEHLREVGKKLFMSSAWYKQSEMYEMAKDYTARLLDDKSNYFICDLPYQASIQAGLLMKETIENTMAEQTFNDISFMMEYEGKFYGSGEDSLFNFKVLNDRRNLKDALHNLDYYFKNNIKIPPKAPGVKRILSADIALLASKKHDNDASAIIINDAVPTTDGNYMSNIIFLDTQEGLVTEELGLLIMRYYYLYDVDYLVIDANGIGQAILDYLMQDRFDSKYSKHYPALNCCNNDELAERCKIKTAPKVIYAIKGTAKSNNDMCLALRAGFQNGYINLLIIENDIEEYLAKHIKGYKELSDSDQAQLKVPYIQTTFMIDELINLDHEINNGLIKVKEKSGMRKDRYSALEYNYYCVQQLALKRKPRKYSSKKYSTLFSAKMPRFHKNF